MALEVTGFEYKLLTYLLLGQDRVISKTELTEYLYAQDFERDSNVIEVLIGRLRRKFSPHGFNSNGPWSRLMISR